MNKGRILISMVIIVVALALSLGATMAFFSHDIAAPTNTFQAGTVEIEDGGEIVTGGDVNNVNPGDCFVKCFTIVNTGSKAIELRMTDFAGEWSFNGNTSGLPLLYDAGPLYIAPHHETDWKMRQVGDSFEFYYTAGPIAAGDSVELCIIVAFDGPKMTDDYQDITLTLTGSFYAVQASNNAPAEVWTDANWADWTAENGWFSMNHYEGLEFSMGADYANYYETTKCFNGNGGNGGDPEPKLTIIKELLDTNEANVLNSDVEFTATLTGGSGAFVNGEDFTFSVNSPKVFGPNDGLEFGVEYTVTEQEHNDYDFISIDPATPFTLTAENNEVTVTIVNQEKENNGNGGRTETAYGGDSAGGGSAWWYYFNTSGPDTQTIWAGQNDNAGSVTVSDPIDNQVTITIDLVGWELQDGDETVKIQGYDVAPDSRPPSGPFTTYKGNELEISVPFSNIFVIHLDVQEE